LLLVLAGCATGEVGTSSAPPAPTSTAPSTTATSTTAPGTAADLGIELFADYPRYLWHKRRLAIATTNAGAEPIEVRLVGLVADHFAVLAPEVKSALIPPGSRTDLQVDFGELVDCGGATALSAAVEIEVARPPGSPAQHAVVPIDPAPLDTIRDEECAQLVVTDAVDIRFAEESAVEGGVLATELIIDRRAGDEVVTASSLRGTELIGLQQAPQTTDPVAVLDPGEASVRVPVEFQVIRCDPHAVGQSTRTYDFKLWVAVGDREAQLMILAPNPELKSRLQQLIARCVEEGGP
jgi:hypothetical protein